jgi:hypothetical protein
MPMVCKSSEKKAQRFCSSAVAIFILKYLTMICHCGVYLDAISYPLPIQEERDLVCFRYSKKPRNRLAEALQFITEKMSLFLSPFVFLNFQT